jgi:Family of unknown function (DUF6496)
MMAKCGKAARKSVKRALEREKRGTLRSGKGGEGGEEAGFWAGRCKGVGCRQ